MLLLKILKYIVRYFNYVQLYKRDKLRLRHVMSFCPIFKITKKLLIISVCYSKQHLSNIHWEKLIYAHKTQ